MSEITEYLQNVEKEMVEQVVQLVNQKSVKKNESEHYPFGEDIHQVLNYFFEEVENFEFDRQGRFEDYYGWVEIGELHHPLVGAVCHLDVVDFVEEDWKQNPYGEVVGDTIFGRGVVDNKGPVIQMLYVMQYIKKNNLPLRMRLIVGTDEEKDFSGMKKYIENDEEMPKYGIIPDAKFPYILSEKGIVNVTLTIDEEQFGSPIQSITGGTGTNITPNEATLVFKDGKKITATGVAAHVANDSTDDNAIVSLLSKIEEVPVADRFVDKFQQISHTNHLTLRVDGEGIVVKPTMIEKNGDKIEVTFDTRVPIETSTENVKTTLLDYFEMNEEAIIRINQADGYEYAEDHPVVNIAKKVYEENLHHLRPDAEVTEPLRIAGTTYGKYFKNCIVFGPGFPGEHSYAHREDERISIQSFMDGTYMYIKLFEEFAKAADVLKNTL